MADDILEGVTRFRKSHRKRHERIASNANKRSMLSNVKKKKIVGPKPKSRLEGLKKTAKTLASLGVSQANPRWWTDKGTFKRSLPGSIIRGAVEPPTRFGKMVADSARGRGPSREEAIEGAADLGLWAGGGSALYGARTQYGSQVRNVLRSGAGRVASKIIGSKPEPSMLRAAIKTKDGRIFTGLSHEHAWRQSGLPVFDDGTRGFITHSGKFLDRRQARLYAIKNKLWRKDVPQERRDIPELIAEDIIISRNEFGKRPVRK
jgi:hypothetical protein